MADTTKKIIEFSELPQDVRKWLFSSLCAYEVRKILDKIKPPSDKENVLALLVGQVACKDIEAKDFIPELAKQLNIPIAAAQSVGVEVKNSVLKPIANSLWKNLQINLDDLTKLPPYSAPSGASQGKPPQPTAREIPFVAPSFAKATEGKPAVPPVKQQGWQETPKARVMEFAPMTDVRKPQNLEKPPVVSQPFAQPKPKEPDVVQTPKPFGLSESVPAAPIKAEPSSFASPLPLRATEDKHELTEYKDEHPMNTSS